MNRIIHFLRASRMVVILLHATLLTATAAQTADLSRGAGGPPTEKRRLCLGERAAFYGRANGSVRFTAGAKNIHSERYEPVFTPSRPFAFSYKEREQHRQCKDAEDDSQADGRRHFYMRNGQV